MNKKTKGIFLSAILGITIWYLVYTLLGGLIGVILGIVLAWAFHKWLVWPLFK